MTSMPGTRDRGEDPDDNMDDYTNYGDDVKEDDRDGDADEDDSDTDNSAHSDDEIINSHPTEQIDYNADTPTLSFGLKCAGFDEKRQKRASRNLNLERFKLRDWSKSCCHCVL